MQLRASWPQQALFITFTFGPLFLCFLVYPALVRFLIWTQIAQTKGRVKPKWLQFLFDRCSGATVF